MFFHERGVGGGTGGGAEEGEGLSGRRWTAVPAELPSRAVTASSARSLAACQPVIISI